MRHYIRYGIGAEILISEDEYIAIWERCGSPPIDKEGCFSGVDPEDRCPIYGRATKQSDEADLGGA